mmetsp:Transcript_65894/g.150953  ORF Transcript_65894/g.150953 Transcript_65894/m.150953 type:complete len:345 (-) Transcript_65894:18-1052(-)
MYSSDEGVFDATLRWEATVVQSCVRRWELWAALLWHVSLACLHHSGILDIESEEFRWLQVPQANSQILTGLLTFFIVFYSNHCYDRYTRLYELCRAAFTHTVDAAIMIRMSYRIPRKGTLEEGQRCVQLSVRYLLASVILFFMDVLQDEIEEKDWAFLQEAGLLQPVTVRLLSDDTPPFQSALAVYWAYEVVGSGLGSDRDRVMKIINNHFWQIHADLREISDTRLLPIPFGYYHVMNLMLCVNIILWGYGMALESRVLAHLIYLLCVLIFMGMRELAAQLADPFGDDLVDFPVRYWILQCWEECVIVLEHELDGDVHARQLEQGGPLSGHLDVAVRFFSTSEA